MARDTRGDLWVATLAGLSRLRGDTISNFTTANGLSSNVVTALLPRADGTLLIGTQEHGWDAWDGNRFSAATQNSLEQTTIHAILDDGSGHLWFATGNGIARCDCNEMSGQARRAVVRTGWNLGPRMGCTAVRRQPTVILQRGARATGNCGLRRRGDWWKWIRHTFP